MTRAYYLAAFLLSLAIAFEFGYFRGKADRRDEDVVLLSQREDVIAVLEADLRASKRLLDNSNSELEECEEHDREVFEFIDDSNCAEDIHQEMYDAD